MADWVTYGDAVVVADAVSDREIPPADSEIDRGEGLIMRQVHFQVRQALWQREGAPRPAPDAFDFTALGWQFSDGSLDNRTEMVPEGTSRLEVGHRYLVVLDWQEERCSPGDPRQPAQWETLGSGSVLPYDVDAVGQGEFEGRQVSSAAATERAKSAAADGSALATLDGMSAQKIRTTIADTPAQEPRDYGPPPAPCA